MYLNTEERNATINTLYLVFKDFIVKLLLPLSFSITLCLKLQVVAVLFSSLFYSSLLEKVLIVVDKLVVMETNWYSEL